MLNIDKNKNKIFLIAIYILVLFIELFHFGSDIYIIMMSESLLCFIALLYVLSFTVQEMFVLGLQTITLKYNYIYILFKNIVNLNINVYDIFINNLYFFLFLIFKNFFIFKNLKNLLMNEYFITLKFFKKEKKIYFQQFNLILFI